MSINRVVSNASNAIVSVSKKTIKNIKGIQDPIKTPRLKYDTFISSRKTASKAKTELPLTEKVKQTLSELTDRLVSEYKTFQKDSAEKIENFIGYDKSGKYFNGMENSQQNYSAITARSKDKDSVLSKLESKYKKGGLDLTGDIEKDISSARVLVADAYGSRLQLKTITEADYNAILFKNQIKKSEFEAAMKAYIQNPEILPDAKFLEVLEALKEKQTEDIFKTLKNGIINKSIDVTEISNYGNEVTSYFTTRQMHELVDAYSEVHPSEMLKISTSNAQEITNAITSKANYDDYSSISGNYKGLKKEKVKDLLDKRYKTSDGKILKLEEIIDNKSKKASGYPSLHVNSTQVLSSNSKTGIGYNEFQIRGTEVNKFGDQEHAVYDIKQQKKGSYESHMDIYECLSKMNEKEKEQYNKYLSQLYSFFRLQELGANVGKLPPELNMGKAFPNNILGYSALSKLA